MRPLCTPSDNRTVEWENLTTTLRLSDQCKRRLNVLSLRLDLKRTSSNNFVKILFEMQLLLALINVLQLDVIKSKRFSGDVTLRKLLCLVSLHLTFSRM